MLIDCHTHVGAEMGTYLRGEFPYSQHYSAMVAEGRPLGISHWIVFPMVTHVALNLGELRNGVVTPEGALETVPYRWENRRLMQEVYELFPEDGASALPFAMFDPARSTKEQETALRALRADYRFYGLKTQTTMLQSNITALREQGRVFLELAREWDIPLLIHSSVLPSDTWAQAADIIDIAEENPDVRFIAAHSCRFDRECLDRIQALPNCWYDCSAHGIHCDLAVRESAVVAPRARRFESDYSRPGQVLADMAEAYPDKLIWGSDAPYYSWAARIEFENTSLLSTYALEVEYFRALPAAAQRRSGWENTLAWLGAGAGLRADA